MDYYGISWNLNVFHCCNSFINMKSHEIQCKFYEATSSMKLYELLWNCNTTVPSKLESPQGNLYWVEFPWRMSPATGFLPCQWIHVWLISMENFDRIRSELEFSHGNLMKNSHSQSWLGGNFPAQDSCRRCFSMEMGYSISQYETGLL